MATTQNQHSRSQQPEQQNRLMVGGVALLGLAAIGALALLGGQSSFEPTPSPNLAVQHRASAPGAPQVSVVRVDAGGNAVIAGEAPPGATIKLKSDGTTIGTTIADANGAFSFVTSKPLEPGDQEITLSSRVASGVEQAPAHGVMVDVPAMPSEGPLALLTGKGLTSSRIFGDEKQERAPKGGPLAIGSVDYSGTGSALVTGTAPPDNQVELLLGNVTLGHTLSGANGRWEMHLQTLPRLSGQFHLKASRPHSGASPANTAYRLLTPHWPEAAQLLRVS